MQTEFKTPGSVANGQGVGSTSSAIAKADDAPSEYHNFLADVEDLITATTSLTGEDLAQAKAKLSARVASAKDSVQKIGGTIAHHSRKTASVTNGYVHEQPWNAVGIGAAVGFLLGFVFARRA